MGLEWNLPESPTAFFLTIGQCFLPEISVEGDTHVPCFNSHSGSEVQCQHTHGSFSSHLWFPPSQPWVIVQLRFGGVFILSTALNQVTPWTTTMADPSPPMTRTQTRPSPTALCPTKELSGIRTVIVSTWWADMGTTTTVRWVVCDSSQLTRLGKQGVGEGRALQLENVLSFITVRSPNGTADQLR